MKIQVLDAHPRRRTSGTPLCWAAVRVKALAIIQVGGGIWGRGWAELTHRAAGFRLAALVDASAKVREWASAEFGVPVFARLDRALEGVRSRRGAPCLTARHAQAARRSGARGRAPRHLREAVERSNSRTPWRSLEMAERTGLNVMVAQNYRFRRQPRALRTLVSTGALGPLTGIRIACRRDLRDARISRQAWRAEMAHPYLLEMAIHHVDLLRMITGREVAQLDALAWKVPDSPFRKEPNVSALLVLDDGTPVGVRGRLRRVRRRDVVERGVGVRRRPGAGDVGRRGQQPPARNGRARALRLAAGAGRPAEAPGARQARRAAGDAARHRRRGRP